VARLVSARGSLVGSGLVEPLLLVLESVIRLPFCYWGSTELAAGHGVEGRKLLKGNGRKGEVGSVTQPAAFVADILGRSS
jgi:hypothetical protein